MYISIEGVECCGKSTQVKLLSDALIQDGFDVFVTKEPGSPHDPVCQEIRKLLLNKDNKITDRAALFLFLADRSQHMEVVTDALARDKIVISDRSSFSTYVYHTALERGFVEDEDIFLCSMLDMAQQISPDICFVLSAEQEWSKERMKQRAELDRIESFNESFHLKTHMLFEEKNINKVASMMLRAPGFIYFAPKSSQCTEDQIGTYILDKVYRHLEKKDE